ncbi:MULTISPECIES: hypothetical protein [Burkholderiaceae]|uniref:hypothetical protein n=1 Tax=Burkholderiaceae TaxID=119060 RepID=UPI00147A172A|nr:MULTISPECIES: hypothetical protein [Burkholderiaceae]MCG1041003.1 hypothetical protein [Mycetohabitans sp. B7]
MRKIKEVLRLKLEARLSHEQIAAALDLSKGVVTKYVGLAAMRISAIMDGRIRLMVDGVSA